MDLNNEDGNLLQNDIKPLEKIKVRLRPPFCVPDLKEMAASRVAVALWNHVNLPVVVMRNGFQQLLMSDLRKAPQWTTELTIPASLASKIDVHASKVLEEVNAWVSYHYRQVFFNYKDACSLYCHVYFFVWRPDGTINYEQTARNLSQSARLSEIDKYHLLCTFCLREDIDRISPVVYDFLDYVNFQKHPLILYWNCYVRRELHKIASYLDLDFFMINQENVDNWPAIEYFFDRLTYDDQVQIANWLIDKYGIKFQKLVLMKLDEPQRNLVYSDPNRGVQIIMNFIKSIEINYQDIYTVWLEIRYSITSHQFTTLFYELLRATSYGMILKEIWNSVDDHFKINFLNSVADLDVVKKLLMFWMRDHEDDFFFTLVSNFDEKAKEALAYKDFFTEACEELISKDELKSLEMLLSSCLINVEDSAKFKQTLVRTFFFHGWCKKLLMECEVVKLERLLHLCILDRQEMIEFTRGFTSNDFFVQVCIKLIVENKLPTLERLLGIFMTETLDRLRFKQDLASMPFFKDYCEKLTYYEQFNKIDELLNWSLRNAEKVADFKRTFVLNSVVVRRRCLELYSSGQLHPVNVLLVRFLSPYPHVIIEYKKNLLMSSEGLDISVQVFEKSDLLTRIITEGFVSADFAAELRKTVVFCDPIIEKLRNMIPEEGCNAVQVLIDQYLSSEEDKRALKIRLLDHPAQVMGKIFHEYGDSGWQAVMKWCLRDENLVREFKSTLKLDTVLDEVLKCCIFKKYAEGGLLSKCVFQKVISFESADQFLNWYFSTSCERKQYKLQRIGSYMDIDVVKTLMKKKDTSYLRKVFDWFFEGDDGEISKFLVNNESKPILKVF